MFFLKGSFIGATHACPPQTLLRIAFLGAISTSAPCAAFLDPIISTPTNREKVQSSFFNNGRVLFVTMSCTLQKTESEFA